MRYFLTPILLLYAWSIHAQSTFTYTVDNDFDAGQKFRANGSVDELYSLSDGGYFAAGSFQTMFTNPSSPFPYGGGMITANGGVHPDWEDGTVLTAIRELHEYQGGYIFSANFGQTILKMTYTGISWYVIFGEMWADYFRPSNAEYTNPYNVNWGWDVYIQEDEKVLIAGSIATDTLQPNVYRHLTRVLPDGSHDENFPVIEASPINPNTFISKIEKASNGYWYVSGNFEGINGHISPHIARLTPDFDVDPTFISPLYFEQTSSNLPTELIYLDNTDRIWMAGRQVKLDSNPDEIFHLVRILSDGEVDPDFIMGKVNSDLWDFGFQRPPAIHKVVQNDFGHYYVLGSFSHYNDTTQLCITAIDDEGNIQENYFGGNGATPNYYDPDDDTNFRRPRVSECVFLEDGGLLIGGAFSNFMGSEKYSIVKLNQGTVSTLDQDRLEGKMKLFPNPARDQITVEFTEPPGGNIETLQILDLSGRTVATYPWQGNLGNYDVSDLAEGLYIVEIVQEGRQISSNKIIVQH